MKKFIQVLTLVIAMSLTITNRQANAGIGALVSPGVVIAGLIVTGTGAGLMVAGEVVNYASWDDDWAGMGFVMWGALIGLVGLVVLDGDQTLTFTSISERDAASLNLTQNELLNYNAELDQINTLTHHIAGELNENSTAKDSAQKWSDYRNLISPEAFSAMEKIATQK